MFKDFLVLRTDSRKQIKDVKYMYQTKEQLPVPESAVGFGWFAQAVQLAKYNKKRKLQL